MKTKEEYIKSLIRERDFINLQITELDRGAMIMTIFTIEFALFALIISLLT